MDRLPAALVARVGRASGFRDGRYLAAVARNRDAGTSELKIFPVDGGEARVIHSVTRPSVVTWPSWTPDSKHVLVKHVSSDPAVDEALAVPIDGGAPKRLDLPGVKFGFMSMHADGKRIAYLAGEDEDEVLGARKLPAGGSDGVRKEVGQASHGGAVPFHGIALLGPRRLTVAVFTLLGDSFGVG